MSLENLTYEELEITCNKFYGFLVIPFILTLIKLNLLTKNIKCTKFQTEFFFLLLQQSFLKYNLLLSIFAFTFFAFKNEAWLLSLLIVAFTIVTSIKITSLLKSTVIYLQSVENAAIKKARVIAK
jgi:hypothetical protein